MICLPLSLLLIYINHSYTILSIVIQLNIMKKILLGTVGTLLLGLSLFMFIDYFSEWKVALHTHTHSHGFCGHDVLYQKAPALINKQEILERQLLGAIQNGYVGSSTRATYTIPVVVHIVHANSVNRISDNQVQTAIQHLNDAFANVGVYNPATGVDVDIDFCLAQRTPTGTATNGITSTVDPLANLNYQLQDGALKNLIRWNPLDYLNIWVVDDIAGGVAGYAYLPAAHGSSVDGIVVENDYMGSNTDDTKVLVHEVGHYLGLYHTFQGGCTNSNCLVDNDRVCDTPPDNTTVWVSCNTNTNSCQTDEDDISTNNPFRPTANGGIGDQSDQKENYMDYSRLECYDRFTQGQKIRMQFFLTGARASLLSSQGCSSPCTNPINLNITTTNTIVQQGTTLNFTSTGTGATQYDWSYNGTSFATTANASYTFNTIGVHSIALEAQNGDPNCTEVVIIDITVACPAVASFNSSQLIAPQNSNVGFFANGTGSITNYQWSIDGVVQGSTIGTMNALFPNSGYFDVELIVSNGSCSDTMTQGITITSLTNNNYNTVGTGASINQISNGTCAGTASSCFRITPDISTPQAGAIWNLRPLNLRESFDISLCVYLGNRDGGADGIAFVLQNSGINVVGQTGGYLGLQGLSPSVGIEIDGFNNGVNTFGDIAADHIAVNYNGLSAPSEAGPVSALASGQNIEDGSPHTFRIVWDALCQEFAIYMDGNLRLRHTDDIVNTVFSGNPTVFWGMTGGTFSQSNLQEFCFNSLTTTSHSNLQDTCINPNSTLTLNATQVGATSYLWQNGATTSSIDVTNTGVYWVDMVLPNCNVRDTIVVTACAIDTCNTTYQKAIGGLNDDAAESIIQTNDGGVLLIGNSNSFGLINQRGYIVKLDIRGDIQWSKVIGNSQAERFTDGIQNPDGTYILVGESFQSGKTNQYIVKTDNTGNVIWSRVVQGSAGNDFAAAITHARNGDYILASTLNGNGSGGLVRIDDSGNTTWARSYTLGSSYWLNNVIELSNGDLITTGFNAGSNVIIKTDINGQLKWVKTFGTGGISRLIHTSDNHLIVGGLIPPSVGFPNNRASITKLDTAGNIIWSRTYGTTGEDNRVHGLAEAPNGDILSCLYAPNADFKLLNITSTGNLNWSKAYGSSIRTEEAWFTLVTNTGATISTGRTNGAIGGLDMYVLRTTPQGSSSGCLEQNYQPVVSSPSYTVTTTTGTATNQNSTINVTDLVANVVSTENVYCSNLNLLPPNLGPDTTICKNGIIDLNAGTGYSSYRWQDNSSDSTLTVFLEGLYWVEVEDACGILLRDSIYVTIDSIGLINLPDTFICVGDTLPINLPTTYTYDWQGSQQISCLNCNNPQLYPTNTQMYYVLASNSNGCFTQDSFEIQVNTCGTINTTVDTTICENEQFVYDGNILLPDTIQTYRYLSSGGLDSFVTVNVRGIDTSLVTIDTAICQGNTLSYDGQFLQIGTSTTFNYTNVGGCDSTVIVNVTGLDTFAMTVDTAICLGTTINYNGQILQSGTTTTLNYTSARGCDSTVVLNVNGLDTFRIVLDSIATSAVTYNGQLVDLGTTTIFNLQTSSGCDSIVIFNLSQGFIGIPDAFTPNGDGINDLFRPVGIKREAITRFRIYNRFGNLVYQGDNLENDGWDGRLNGVTQPREVYIYVLVYTIGNETKTLKGQLTLLR